MKFEFHTRIPLFFSHLEQINPGNGAGDIDQGIDPTKAIKVRLFIWCVSLNVGAVENSPFCVREVADSPI